MKKQYFFFAIIGVLLIACKGQQENKSKAPNFVIGSYAAADEPGIKAYSFDFATGDADSVSALCGISNPSYIVLSPDRNMIYSVGEDAGASSTMNAISFNTETGEMALIESLPTGGGAPCYIEVSPDGSQVITANYMGGSVSLAGIDRDGKFVADANVLQMYGRGPDSLRQNQPHLHCVTFTPDGSQMLASDLGKDRIYVFDAAALQADALPVDSVALEPGSGPRHIVFDNAGKYAYLINEISGYVTVMDATNSFQPVQYALCDSLGAQGSGDIRLSPDGRFLYASNRLQGDGIAIYEIDANTGLINQIAYQPTGLHPRNFAISPDGNYLLVACRDDNKIQVFSRDSATGLLTDLHKDIATPRPVCIKFL